jgi:hypothetical protein
VEGLARLVNESLARHGVETTLDHRRLRWSNWFHCPDSSSVLLVLVPSKPGLFALGEEVLAPGELPSISAKRMLALFQISSVEDLGMSLGRLFLPGSPQKERLDTGRCFARYSVIEDSVQRQTAYAALQQWHSSNAGAASGFGTEPDQLQEKPVLSSQVPLPSGF